MKLSNIPDDINVELLLSWLDKGSFGIEIKGQHKRNAYNDIIEVETAYDNTIIFHIGRSGLYNALPEYLFHPLNRFDNLPANEEKERFAEEMEKQEQEKNNAIRFFEPMDLLLLLYRVMAREKLRNVTEENSVLMGMICDKLAEGNRNNRFIKRTIPFITNCRHVRGNKTLLTQMLRKILMDEGLKVSVSDGLMVWKDESPRYADNLGEDMDDFFLGNIHDEDAIVLDIEYWPDTLDDNFPQLLDDLEEYRSFVSDFFISVEEVLKFKLSNDDDIIVLGDNSRYNYLNYNTNL